MKRLRCCALFFLFGTIAASASERPSVRVFTFTSNYPWEAIETIYRPVGDTHYRTESHGSHFKVSSDRCGDLLSTYQKRPLDVMLKNRYINREFYDQLMDPWQRVQDMRQYVLVSLFLDLSDEEIRQRQIPKEQILEESPGGAENFRKRRVHLGSMFALRGHHLERAGLDRFSVTPAKLPWEHEPIPTTLQRPLVRQNLPAAVEIGRALVEKGAGRKSFALLMQVLVTILQSDARVLGLDPRGIPVTGHALDVAHVRLFAQTFSGRPMTPAMQEELEANPREALTRFEASPMPEREEWDRFNDAVVVGSLQKLIDQYPVDALSDFARRLQGILPAYVTAEQRMAITQGLAAIGREDFDFKGHDLHRAGQRAPVQIRDWGTGLWGIRISRLLEKNGVPRDLERVKAVVDLLSKSNIKKDADFGGEEWLEKNIYVGMPNFKVNDFKVNEGEMLPLIAVSNLDAQVPSAEMPKYLGQILLATSAQIVNDLESLDADERDGLTQEMNETRALKGLSGIHSGQINLLTFLETYDLVFGTNDETMAIHLKMMGASLMQGLRLNNPFRGGHMDIQIDPQKLGIDLVKLMANPQAFQAVLEREALRLMFGIVQPATVYRFGINEVREQTEEFIMEAHMGSKKTLLRSLHPQKLQRHYITYL